MPEDSETRKEDVNGEKKDRERDRDRDRARDRDRERGDRDRDRNRDRERIRDRGDRERNRDRERPRDRDRDRGRGGPRDGPFRGRLRGDVRDRDRSPIMKRRRPMLRERNRIDREKVCPLLLRVFCRLGEHHTAEDFKNPEKEPVEDEFQIYTWKDATLGELTSLIKAVRSAARRRSTRLSFAFVYPDRSGKKVVREVGQTYSTRRSEDGSKSLMDLNFETGDYLDVAIHLK